MTSTDFGDTAREWARRLEDREASRSECPIAAARASVARRVGVSPGTLENLRNGRLKTVAVHIFAGLRAAIERDIQAEIDALENELVAARAAGLELSEAPLRAAEAALGAARQALMRGR